MSEEKDLKINEEKQDVVATPKENGADLLSLVQAIVTPFAQSQETSEKEETKRESIRAEVTGKLVARVFYIAIGVLIIAGIALFKDDARLTETIVTALVAFLGGFGFGRSSVANKISA